jgi:outer membrane receptor protein involved in Fe transport
VEADLTGKELPNAPSWTVSIGAQYEWELPSGWFAMVRADFFSQADSWARVYNGPIDELRAWDNLSMSLRLSKPEADLQIEAYVKNVFDDRPLTDTFFNDDALGLLPRSFLLEPRTYGIALAKSF